MINKKTLIVNGDSWTFGSEILNPTLDRISDIVTEQDFFENNDSYRIPRIYPTHLSKLMHADLINLSWPADDNKTILNRTISYICEHYIEPTKSTKDLLVIIGWTSPERNSFWWKDEKISNLFRLWPHIRHFDRPLQENFWKIYVDSMWNEEEYIPRFILNVLQFQNFCNQYDIKWMCFNAFASDSKDKESFSEWSDLDIRKSLNSHTKYVGGTPITISEPHSRQSHNFNYLKVWDTIDDVRFYKKDEKYNTFKSFITENVNEEDGWYGIHPSPHSHEMWAKELYNYIDRNNLL
jgi:hypothetical protein